VSVALYRIDDRLIHGQVVVGWGQSLRAGFIALVDDVVRASDWEQELYRMGVPGSVDVRFASVAEAAAAVGAWEADPRVGIVLTGDIATMAALCAAAPSVRRVNVGGVHFRPGRTERLRFVYLTDEEAAALRALAGMGVSVTAQDVPTASPVPLEAFA
jgi:PTS system mannose-specific IIB component/fructoselysine and glucoselysine-specific PTS system IIB component